MAVTSDPQEFWAQAPVNRTECANSRYPPGVALVAALDRIGNQPQRWHETGVGQPDQRDLLVGIELHLLRWCVQQHRDHTVVTVHALPGAGVAVDDHDVLASRRLPA